MPSIRRWLVVLTGTAVLIALPTAVAALPAGSSSVSAAELLARIDHSQGVAYSGYAESSGGLSLPVTSQFSTISDLFGGQTQLRAWWRSATDWRVDSIGFAGESDVHRAAAGDWAWNFESNTATWTQQPVAPEVRLPTAADLLPPELGRRLLSQATPDRTSRLESARIAGRNAPGIRVVPSQAESSIAEVDVWADARTGLPLRVAVRGKQAGSPAISSSFLDVSLATPSASSTGFTPPPGANLHSGPPEDLATTIDQLGGAAPPAKLAGVARNPLLPTLGSVGIYGRGVTEFVVVPLPRHTAFSLRSQLAKANGGQFDENSLSSNLNLSIGPLNLLMTSFDQPSGPWLLIGTVDATLLAGAATQLPINTTGR